MDVRPFGFLPVFSRYLMGFSLDPDVLSYLQWKHGTGFPHFPVVAHGCLQVFGFQAFVDLSNLSLRSSLIVPTLNLMQGHRSSSLF